MDALGRRHFLTNAAAVGVGGIDLLHWPALANAVGPRMPFAVGIVDTAIGDSIFYSEYKGDYAKAERLSDIALLTARRAKDSGQLADALRSRGVVAMLQGETGLALALFAETESLTIDDPDRKLWLASYAQGAFRLALAIWPGGMSATSDELDWRQKTKHGEESPWAHYWRRHWEATNAYPKLSDKAAASLINHLFFTLPSLRFNAGFELKFGKDSSAKLREMFITALRTDTAAVGNSFVAAYVLSQEADIARRRGEMPAANQALADARELYRRLGDSRGEAASYILEGDWYASPLTTPETGNFMMLGGATGAESDPDWKTDELELDKSRIDAARAMSLYARAEELARIAKAPRALAALKFRAGYLRGLGGDYAAAVKSYNQAATSSLACRDMLGYWNARIQGALSKIGQGEFSEDSVTARALGQWGAGKGCFAHAHGLGMVCQRVGHHWIIEAGDHERALACYRLAEALYEVLGAPIDRAQSIVDQGRIYSFIGESDAASQKLRFALDLYLSVSKAHPLLEKGDLQRAASTGATLLNTYFSDQSPDNILRVARVVKEACARIYEIPDPPAGGYPDPRFPLSKVLAASVSQQVDMALVFASAKQALNARRAGNLSESEQLFDQAILNARALAGDDKFWMEAMVQGSRRKYDLVELAVESFLQDKTNELNIPPDVELLPGVVNAERQRRANHKYKLAFSVCARFKCYRAADRYLGILQAEGGADWWERSERPWQEAGDIALVHEGMGRREQAAASYEAAIKILETQRSRLRRDESRTAFAGALMAQYLFFQAARNSMDAAANHSFDGDFAKRGGLVAQGFTYAERGKARALLDLMAGSALSVNADKTINETIRSWREVTAKVALWRSLISSEVTGPSPESQRVASLQVKLAEAEETLHGWEQRLAVDAPAFYQVTNRQASLLDASDIASRLPSQTLLIEYFFLQDDFLAWAVDSSGIVGSQRTTLDVESLERDIRSFHQRCEQRADVAEVGTRLSAVLLEPFADALAKHPNLIVVAYGAAHLLPFQALPWKQGPLAASHSVGYLPSASALQYVARGSARGAGGPREDAVLAVGNPAAMAYQPPFGAAQRQKALPAAGVEATYIASQFPKGLALVGAQATAQAVRRAIPKYRLLHFATHGHLSEDAPLSSAILLANGESLTVYELMGMRLAADLVVLSACRTGQGRETGGDDVLGLARGLLAAGARSIIVSLWPVDDFATSILMAEFYKLLRAGQPAHAALQSAQNALRVLTPDDAMRRVREVRGAVDSAFDQPVETGYAHPFYWAPFVLVG